MIELWFDGTFSDWKRTARDALAREIDPSRARWLDERTAQKELVLDDAKNSDTPLDNGSPSRFRVPREFLGLALEASCFRDEKRWSLLYRALWRITQGEPHLLEIAVDADVSALNAMAKAVHRDVHKMHAFVRFREVSTEAGAWFVAWFEPQHFIVELAAPFLPIVRQHVLVDPHAGRLRALGQKKSSVYCRRHS